jgi:hypothetical protein
MLSETLIVQCPKLVERGRALPPPKRRAGSRPSVASPGRRKTVLR